MTEFYEFIGHPLAAELRWRVSSIIWLMALFRNRTHILYSAQLLILHDLIALEENLRDYRIKGSTLRSSATQIALSARQEGRGLTETEKLEVKSLQQEADNYALAVRILRYGRWVYRYLGDAIAWRAYHYRREFIRALGAKEPVPFLSKKDGIDKEINLFKAIRHLGREWLPVMHDLTNCLRTADFSIFRNGIPFRIFELKIRQTESDTACVAPPSRKRGTREERQEKRLQDVMEFLESGDLGKLNPDLAGGRSIKSKIPTRHNFSAISKAVWKARRSGYGFEQPERGLLYLAWDSRKNRIEDALQHANNAYPHIFATLFTFRSINPRYEQYHQSLPITAMDIPTRDIISLLFGSIGLVCLLNYACVEEWCLQNGVPLRFNHSTPGHMRITVDMMPHSGEVGQGLLDRLLLEGLSLTSFTNIIQTIMAEFGAGG